MYALFFFFFFCTTRFPRSLTIPFAYFYWSGCGPSEALWPLFAEFRKLKASEERLSFCCISLDKFSEYLKVMIHEDMLPGLDLNKKGSRPLFLVLRNGECKAVVDGCNAPALKRSIDKFLPPVPESFSD